VIPPVHFWEGIVRLGNFIILEEREEMELGLIFCRRF
jgi:hypothetical protein